MERIKERTAYYEIAVRLINNKYIQVRMTVKLGGVRRRLEKSR